jgi:Sulfotransferase domain
MTGLPTRRPDFIIIGAMKSGTTTLYDMLKASPDIDLPATKEPGILTGGASAEACRRAYARHFSGCAPGTIVGEATTHYTMQTMFGDVSARAREVCGPELRLIAILRDPVERLESHLRHDVQVGRIAAEDAARALADDPRYFETGRYHARLAPWIAAFGRDNLLLVRFSDLVAAPDETLRQVCTFLDARPPAQDMGRVHSNRSQGLRRIRSRALARFVREGAYRRLLRPYLPARLRRGVFRLVSGQNRLDGALLSEATRRALAARYAAENAALAEATGFDVSDWQAGLPESA